MCYPFSEYLARKYTVNLSISIIYILPYALADILGRCAQINVC